MLPKKHLCGNEKRKKRKRNQEFINHNKVLLTNLLLEIMMSMTIMKVIAEMNLTPPKTRLT